MTKAGCTTAATFHRSQECAIRRRMRRLRSMLPNRRTTRWWPHRSGCWPSSLPHSPRSRGSRTVPRADAAAGECRLHHHLNHHRYHLHQCRHRSHHSCHRQNRCPHRKTATQQKERPPSLRLPCHAKRRLYGRRQERRQLARHGSRSSRAPRRVHRRVPAMLARGHLAPTRSQATLCPRAHEPAL